MFTKDEYENKLRGLGCKSIGKGLYSNVFAVPNNDKIVIKVAELDSWPEYIRWATQNGHAGKFAPKVYSLKFHDEYYVAIMERLVCTIREFKYNDDGEYSNFATDQLQIYHNICSWNRDDSECEATDLVAFVAELGKNQLRNDMHDGNVMVRSDGQLVITDPVSGSGCGYSRFRIKNTAFA